MIQSEDGTVDAVIVGAGIIGTACGAVLSRNGFSVLVLERHPVAGRETSSRNSGVIHAGLYYPQESLKATTCREGRIRLYERCAARNIPHRRTGKFVVATRGSELALLQDLLERARENGAGEVDILDGKSIHRREPRVRALAGFWSPESGIVDPHALLASYQAELEMHGSRVVARTRVIGLERSASGLWRIDTESDRAERFSLCAALIVNAAGLECERVARMAGLDTAALGYGLRYAKGDYFALAPSLGALSQALIYPVPVPGGLGTHLTMDLGGRYRLGPDVEYVSKPRLDVDPSKAEPFARAVRRFLPEIRAEHLTPDFAGIRPKLQPPGGPFHDFVVREESTNGAPGLINLLGIESPGLTASEALAEHVSSLAQRVLR